MKVGIMQPYFFPYLGYFSLISFTDKWVVFDIPQFIRHGWIERNRILKLDGSWQYIKVPLIKHSQQTTIKDIYIRNVENWKEKILAQLQHYKRKALYFKETEELLKEIFKYESESIVDTNINAIKQICQYLEMDFNYQFSSDMKIYPSQIKEPDDWALEISKILNAETYVNPIGGVDIFDEKKYISNGIELLFLKNKLVEYKQFNNTFEPGLSIIDVLMFNSIKETKDLIENYELLRKEDI